MFLHLASNVERRDWFKLLLFSHALDSRWPLVHHLDDVWVHSGHGTLGVNCHHIVSGSRHRITVQRLLFGLRSRLGSCRRRWSLLALLLFLLILTRLDLSGLLRLACLPRLSLFLRLWRRRSGFCCPCGASLLGFLVRADVLGNFADDLIVLLLLLVVSLLLL